MITYLMKEGKQKAEGMGQRAEGIGQRAGGMGQRAGERRLLVLSDEF